MDHNELAIPQLPQADPKEFAIMPLIPTNFITWTWKRRTQLVLNPWQNVYCLKANT